MRDRGLKCTASGHSDDPSAGVSLVAIERVYVESFAAFHRAASAITGDRESGRDAVQEAFARAIRSRKAFRGDGPLEGWLWRIVTNVAKDSRRATEGIAANDEVDEIVDTADSSRRDHVDQALRGHLACLPSRQRTALFLRYYADMSYSEIGVALAIKTGTVSATLNAAHTAIRLSLEESAQSELVLANLS